MFSSTDTDAARLPIMAARLGDAFFDFEGWLSSAEKEDS
jgi:hypothetical protein